MNDTRSKEKEYYELALNALAGVEGDLIASDAPSAAIDKVREALRLCNSDYQKRFP